MYVNSVLNTQCPSSEKAETRCSYVGNGTVIHYWCRIELHKASCNQLLVSKSIWKNRDEGNLNLYVIFSFFLKLSFKIFKLMFSSVRKKTFVLICLSLLYLVTEHKPFSVNFRML